MYRDMKVVVVMPAYNAARTLRQTYAEVREQQMVDAIILVDDSSRDETVSVARGLEGVQVHVHEVNALERRLRLAVELRRREYLAVRRRR